MGKRDRRVDAYIAKSADFAQPILTHLRAAVHEACPDADEAIKWGFPFFLRRGALFCYMAAFKQHAAFGFRRGGQVVGEGKRAATEQAMGQFGRITSVDDLPSRRTLGGYVKRAAALHDAEPARATKPTRQPKPAAAKAVAVPADLRTALARNAKARKTFEAFSPSHRREYVAWIAGAKREETRRKRVATAVAWMAEGKSQNWRYER
jgi:uncharacterized protein YdeI (YjbR/CyaY-like superfamily)